MNNFLQIKEFRTYLRLGILNLLRVFIYKVLLYLKIHPVQFIKRSFGEGDYFRCEDCINASNNIKTIRREFLYFNYHSFKEITNTKLDWFYDPFKKRKYPYITQKWWKINECSDTHGDIKVIWETSRFDWVLNLAQDISCGSKTSSEQINNLLKRWTLSNPPFKGPNWKCAQESAFRVIHLMSALRFINQDKKPTMEIVNLIETHLLRISKTTSYAKAQNNNHIITESAALFIGGAWLELFDVSLAKKYKEKGCKLLISSIHNLIEKKGVFSQYSTNYQRLVIDTLCFVELWIRFLKLPKFHKGYYKKVKFAVLWLYTMTNEINGDVPNIGSNDGALLFPIVKSDYRDFRPSLQLAGTLFFRKIFFESNILCKDYLNWFETDITKFDLFKVNKTNHYVSEGFFVINSEDTKLVFRYPLYNFRPPDNDPLHLDLWHKGENILRDGGTYSYNTERSLQKYLSGPKGHNVVEFDYQESMPSITRFLRKNWVKVIDLIKPNFYNKIFSFGASYRTSYGAFHKREVEFIENKIVIKDTIKGFKEIAILRWRLPDISMTLEGFKLTAARFFIEVKSHKAIENIALNDGFESRYYMNLSKVKILEIKISKSSVIETTISLVK